MKSDKLTGQFSVVRIIEVTCPFQGLIIQPVIGQLTSEGAHGIANMVARHTVPAGEDNSIKTEEWHKFCGEHVIKY